MENTETKFTSALVFCLMVLLGYSYIAFLGLLYWKDGELGLPIGLTIGFMAVVLGCLFVMCISKATRWQGIGRAGQIVFGLIILAAFIASAFPFTNFMRVIENKSAIYTEIENTIKAASSLDESYLSYANERFSQYKSDLKSIDYEEKYSICVQGAYGETKSDKIENLKNSLSEKLLPAGMSTIQKSRQDWLKKASGMSVWNLKLPSNLLEIQGVVNKWINNYIDLSSISYMGDTGSAFSYNEFNDQLGKVTAFYKKFDKPSFLAFTLAIVCFLIMLLPYFMTDQSMATAQSEYTDLYE